MDQYRRYYGIITFCAVAIIAFYGSFAIIYPKFTEKNTVISELNDKKQTLDKKTEEKTTVENKIQRIKDSIVSSQKKVYVPTESQRRRYRVYVACIGKL